MTIDSFLNKVNALILNPIITLLFAVSFAYFIYGGVKFLSLDVGDKNRKDAQMSMVWGILGMVIMFSVYGIINFVLGTFGIDKTPFVQYIPI